MRGCGAVLGPESRQNGDVESKYKVSPSIGGEDNDWQESFLEVSLVLYTATEDPGIPYMPDTVPSELSLLTH